MSKTTALCNAVLELLKILDRGGEGAFFVTSTVIGELTWSDYFTLAGRAALLPCKPRPLVLGDDCCAVAGILSMSIPTEGILLYFRQCR